MAKPGKVSFKTYFNSRLKEGDFHGKLTYPLYIQVIYNRNNVQFRSYYFDLLSKPRYALTSGSTRKAPDITGIQQAEANLINFVIGKLNDDFSFEQFKTAYDFYATDLCTAVEEGFRDYLYVFFMDEGLGNLALMVREGAKFGMVYNMVQDLKRVCKPSFFNKLVDNAVYHAPPYLPLFGFMLTFKKWPLLCFSVMEWLDEGIQALFATYLEKNYNAEQAAHISEGIDKLILSLKANIH